MSPTLFLTVVSVASFGQLAADETATERTSEIRRAVRRLSSDVYSTREQASRDLWAFGRHAELALRKAANDSDREVRVRSRQILHDFDYGIEPGVDIETQTLLRDFRDGAKPQQTAAFQQLVDQRRLAVVERLIRLEPDPQDRRLWLVSLFQNSHAVDHYVNRNRIEGLITDVGEDQDERWRRTVTIELMFNPSTLALLAESASLERLLQLIRNETDANLRQNMLAAIFRTRAVGVVLARNELGFVFDALRAEPDKRMRGVLVIAMLSNPQASQVIVAKKQLDRILAFSRESTDATSQLGIVEAVLGSGVIAAALLKEGGVERITNLVSAEPDPIQRGKLLGRTFASSAVRNYLQQNGISNLAIKLAREETNKQARHEFLQALLHDTSFVYSLRDDTTVKELWALIKADDDKTWRARMLAVLLRSHRSNSLLQDEDEAMWILQLAADKTIGPVSEDILRFLLPNASAQRTLIANGHFETMLKLAQELPQRSRGEILGNFIAGSSVAEHLIGTDEVERLIAIVKDVEDQVARQQCLQGVFRNTTAMRALLGGGHYQELLALIQAEDDAARQASLFGAFIRNSNVIDELIKRDDTQLLLTHAESQDEAARRQFLPLLFQNHRAISHLLDEGHFKRLVKLAKSDGGTNFDELLAVPAVIEHLAATDQFSLFLEFTKSEADDNTRRNLLRNVFSRSSAVDALIASKIFPELLDLIQAESDATWRGSLLGPVVSSPAVVNHLAATKNLNLLISIVTDESSAVVRTRLATYLTNRTESVSTFVEHGMLNNLIDLTNAHSTGQTRGSTLARLVTNAKALEELKDNRRIGLLLSFTDDPDESFVAAYISRLMSTEAAINLLIEHGYYNDLFKLATTTGDATARAGLISRLLGSDKAIEQLLVHGNLSTLVSLIRDETDATARRGYLGIVCRNDRLIDEMLKGESFADFVAMLRAEENPAIRDRQLALLVLSEKAIARLAADEQLDAIVNAAFDESDGAVRSSWLQSIVARSGLVKSLIDRGYAEQILDNAMDAVPDRTRESIHRSLLSSSSGVDALMEGEHFEKLWALAKSRGGANLHYLLRNSKVIAHLVNGEQLEKTLVFVSENVPARSRYSVMSSLVRSEAARKAIFEANLVDSLNKSLQSVSESYQRAMLYSALFTSKDVVEHYIANGSTQEFFTFLEANLDPTSRSRVLSSVFARTDIVTMLVEKHGGEQLVRQVENLAQGEVREQLLGRLLSSKPIIDELAAANEIDKLLSYTVDGNGDVQSAFVNRVLGNSYAVGVLIDHGKFEELYELVNKIPSADSRSKMLMLLLQHQPAIDQFVESEQLPTLLASARASSGISLASRRTAIEQVSGNYRLVNELVRANLLEQWVKICEDELELLARRRAIASLLVSEEAIDWFAERKQLETRLTEAFAETDQRRRQEWLTRMFAQPIVFARLAKYNLTDEFLAKATRELSASRVNSLLQSAMSNQSTLTEIAQSGNLAFLLTLARNETDGNRYPSLLLRLISNPAVMSTVVQDDSFGSLLATIQQIENKSYRESALRQALTSRSTLAAFAEQNRLVKLANLIASLDDAKMRQQWLQSTLGSTSSRRLLIKLESFEPIVKLLQVQTEANQSSMLSQLLNDRQLRRTLIDAGRIDELNELAALVKSDDTRARYEKSIVYSPAGVFGHLLRQGKFDEAEALLKQDTTASGISTLVMFYAARQQLGEHIQRLTAIDAKKRSPHESHLLLYLLRANGELDRAFELAEELDNKQLMRPLASELRNWELAAELQATGYLPPPAQAENNSLSTNAQRFDQLAMQASYWRLAGGTDQFNDAIDKLLAFAETHKTDTAIVWYVAEALLLNDRVEDGLRLAKQAHPLKAYNLFLHRFNYGAAFEAIGCKEDFTADETWYNDLPLGRYARDDNRRIQVAVDVAAALLRAGRKDPAESILSLIESQIRAMTADNQASLRRHRWHYYAGGLYRIGLKERAWRIVEEASDPRYGQSSSVASVVFSGRYRESYAWWTIFYKKYGNESITERLQRIDAVINPATPDAIKTMVVAIESAIADTSSSQSSSYFQGLAETCARIGRYDLAVQCLERLDYLSSTTQLAYADALFATQRWDDAGREYEEAWQQDSEQAAWLFMAGVAAERAGDVDKSREMKRLAELHAITPANRRVLALALTERKLFDRANRQWDILLRMAPFESIECNDAARHLAMHRYSDQPDVAVQLWQQYLLGDVRAAFWLLNDASYLSVPAATHKLQALAAIERGEYEAAGRSLELALALCPGTSDHLHAVVPLLDAEEQRGIANRLVEQLVKYLEKRCDEFPNSSLLHNNLAWAAARCHRHLDLAMAHAKRAVELDPNNGGHVDTLAEVFFQQGDRESAIKHGERAVELEPLQKSLQDQLERFRAEPLPAQ